MDDNGFYQRARARVEAKLGFYRHAIIYVLVNLLLLVINLLESPEYLWVKWPMLGWGIGLIAHGLGVFSPRWVGTQKEKMIERELEREKRDRGA
ncbi:MAG: 2TM domain-containing protein [Chthoniobacterales bacterium]